MLDIYINDKLSREQKNYLAKKWEQLSKKLQIPDDSSSAIYIQIKQKYGQDNRKYHNLSHIYSMLRLAEKEQEQTEEPDHLELAIWFHDVIYQPVRKDNEQKSADFAKEILADYCSTAQLELLEKMILSTKKHEPLTDFPDVLWLLDFDLAVLAADSTVYDQYSQAIRQEYNIFPNLIYKPGRKKVLQHFLNMTSIYYTEKFRVQYDHLAQANLRRELAEL